MDKRQRENPEILRMHDVMIKDQLNKGVMKSVDYNSLQWKLKPHIPQYAVVTCN